MTYILYISASRFGGNIIARVFSSGEKRYARVYPSKYKQLKIRRRVS